MKKFISVFLAAFVLMSTEGAKGGELSPPIHDLLEKIAVVRSIDDSPLIFSAFTLRNYMLSHPGYEGESLSSYQFSTPKMIKVVTAENREYILVVFPEKTESPEKKAAFVISQKCEDGDFLSLVHGFFENSEKLAEGFKAASRDSSADYFKWDACSCIKGNDESD